MGASGSKTHQAFTVAPAPAPSPVVGDELDVADEATQSPLLVEIMTASTFAELCTATNHAQAVAVPLLPWEDPPPGAPTAAQIHAAVSTWLAARPGDDLYQLAAAAGLEHAAELSPGAVAHWLDPSYHPAAPSKAAIAAKALERHLAKVADGTIADPPASAPADSWAATPGQLLDAHSAVTAALGAMPAPAATHHWYKPPPPNPAPLTALLAAEQNLATAHCPELAAQHAAACAAAKAAVDAAIDNHPAAARQLVHAGVDAGDIEQATARTLPPADVLALGRATTPAATAADLHATVEARTVQLATELAAHDAVDGLGAGPLDAASIGAFAVNAATYRSARSEVSAWRATAAIPASAPTFVGDDQLAASFRAAAKSTPIGELRAGTIAMGLDKTAAATASRAQLQNWALGAWHPHHNQTAIAAAMTPTPATPPAAPPAPVTTTHGNVSTSSASSGPTAPSGSGLTAGSGRWHAKHAQLVAGLKHHAATLNDLPARPDPAAVAAWTFTAGPALSLGGMHTKSVHTAPDGSTWMFKPDKLGGARATAEASANLILHRVGIPTIPVYERRLGHQPGTIQPLMIGASQLPASPSAWSQADVDAIVRYHAGAWVVGEHDAKHDNLLRTPSGGLVPIDLGQAFKFYGRDKLSATYHPNASYGSTPPVWHQLYEAHRSGGLAPGVTIRPHVAVPVIRAFEAMPDTELASLLRPTATAGAANPAIHWRDTMAARAAAAGHPNPNPAQIADAFIAHGLERKHGLRAGFASLFAAEKIVGADILTKTT